MSNFAYASYREYVPYRIRETAAVIQYESEPQPRYRLWSDDEIARIRIVLRKLTRLRIKNDEDAEDLVQETLLTMTRKCPEGELRKGLLVWTMGILRRKVGNYYRKTRRYASLDGEEALAQKIGRSGTAPISQESRIHHKELRIIINTLLETFPPQERKAMELLLMGLPTREIVQELSPERYQNVANRLHRGRKKLARGLARYGYGPADSSQRRGARKEA